MRKRVSRPTRPRPAPDGREEPLAEGTIPLTKSGRRSWASLSDNELVAYAQSKVQSEGIMSRYGLLKEDKGLYDALYKRDLLDEVKFETSRMDWRSMSDRELIELARTIISQKGIQMRSQLFALDRSLHKALASRKLLDEVGFPIKRQMRNWRIMGDDELMALAGKLIQKKGIVSKKELQKEDGGLYNVLWKRGLLDGFGFERTARDFSSMRDSELLALAQRSIRAYSVRARVGLVARDPSLYNVLRKRELLDDVGFQLEKPFRRDWGSHSDEELVAFGQETVREEGILNRTGLKQKDSGLYQALAKRRLLDSIGLLIGQMKERSWKDKEDWEIINFAVRLIEAKGIRNRSALKKADYGLYHILRKRRLMGAVFSRIHKRMRREVLRQVLEALEEFGDPG